MSWRGPSGSDGRRCRRSPRQGGELRPTDLLGAFFVCGVTFLAAGAAAGVLSALGGWPSARWVALHLVFVGGISQLIIGASQFFVGAFLATDPPARALVRSQLWTWNAGAIILAVSIPERIAAPTWIAVGLLLSGLALYAAGLIAMRRRSLRSAPWATRWYAAGAGFLAVGIVAGTLMARGTAWPHGDLLAVHTTLNLAGWFGAAIVGTLHTFFPSLTQTRLRYPMLQRVAFGGWAVGVVSLAVGYGWSFEWTSVAGWLSLMVAAVALLVNVAVSVHAAPRPLSLPARLVGVAQLFLLAGLLVALEAVIGDGAASAVSGSTRAAVGTLLVAGWVGLTVFGSLLHLLAVVIRVRDFSLAIPSPRPARDSLIAVLATLGVASLALSQLTEATSWRGPVIAVLLGSYALLGARVAALVGRVVVRARPHI